MKESSSREREREVTTITGVTGVTGITEVTSSDRSDRSDSVTDIAAVTAVSHSGISGISDFPAIPPGAGGVSMRTDIKAVTSRKAPTLTFPIAEPASTSVTPSCAATAVFRNRALMPHIATVADTIRAVFGPVKIIHVVENGCELGKVPDPGVIAYPPHVPSKSKKRGQL